MAAATSANNIHTLATRVVSPSSPRDNYDFSFTPFLIKNFSFGLARDVPVCNAYREGHCPLGPLCPDRHPTPSRIATATSPAIAPSSTHGTLVCKHYLKGLCKKGIKCEYLHEYNLRRMPECQSFARSNYCANGDECLYQHIPFDAKIPLCEHYERGFCPLGPHCAKKHVRKTLCPFYLAGFCPEGPKCGKAHPRFVPDEKLEKPRKKSDKTEEEREMELARIREEQEKEKERERQWRSQNRRGGDFVKRFGPRKF